MPPHPRAAFVEGLLRHLEAAGFEGAPRTLGRDRQGRHVMTFVAWDVQHGPPYGLSDRQLLSAIDLICRFHDATAGSSLCADQEVVCHGDLGPHNTIFRGQDAIAIIDWDRDVAPGRRAVDIFDQFVGWMQRHGPELADPPAPD